MLRAPEYPLDIRGVPIFSNVTLMLAAFAKTTSLSLLTVAPLLSEISDSNIPAFPTK